ncbi:MAG: lipoyl(octanoyl) transferase LipB [Gammaproteobacteria bacterium]|nr:lipoyl(octanoyl) transferase LipB [Gammaproteobacteria bacterium]
MLTNYKHFNAESSSGEHPPLVVRRLGLQEYEPIWKSMRYLVEQAKPDRVDEIWLLSHKPVFTQGQAGKAEHILSPAQIPVVQIDRGGQVTYHGPGQLVVYLLLNMKRRKMGVRDLVDLIEKAIIQALQEFGIAAGNRVKAPGVYVNDAKIAALGLRIRNGWSYHGLSLNVQMDLEPFSRINPCGYEDLTVTQIADHVPDTDTLMQKVSRVLSNKLLSELGYIEYYKSD